MRWEGHIASMGGFAYRVLVGKPEVKRLFERPRRRWKDNIIYASSRSGIGTWTGLSWSRILTDGGLL